MGAMEVSFNGEPLTPEPRLYGPRVAEISLTAPIHDVTGVTREFIERWPQPRVITVNLAETPDPVPAAIKRGRPIRLFMTTLAEPVVIVGRVRYRRLRKIVIDGRIEPLPSETDTP